MDRTSDRYGPKKDDELKRELSGLLQGHPTRVEAELDPEPPPTTTLTYLAGTRTPRRGIGATPRRTGHSIWSEPTIPRTRGSLAA